MKSMLLVVWEMTMAISRLRCFLLHCLCTLSLWCMANPNSNFSIENVPDDSTPESNQMANSFIQLVFAIV